MIVPPLQKLYCEDCKVWRFERSSRDQWAVSRGRMGKGKSRWEVAESESENENSQKLVSVTYVANARGDGSWVGSLAWNHPPSPRSTSPCYLTFPPSNYPQPSLKEIELSDASTAILRAATSFQDVPINGNRDKNPPLPSIHSSYPVNRVNNFRRSNIYFFVGWKRDSRNEVKKYNLVNDVLFESRAYCGWSLHILNLYLQNMYHITLRFYIINNENEKILKYLRHLK